MSNKTLKIHELFNASGLVLRKDARLLFDFVSKEHEEKITLDFEKIQYSSLSFMDELNNIFIDLKNTGKVINLVNLCEDLKKLLELVKKRPDSINNITNASISFPGVTKI